jgi:hypothetical protein
MPAPQEPKNRTQRRDHMQRLRHQGAPRWWEQDPKSIGTACVITSTGAILIAIFVVAAITHDDRYAGPLLLFGCALFLFGSLILLFALVEWVAHRFIHPKKYCGCCVFYKPQGDEYDVGLCRSDPREGYVERTHSCPYFRYSERAMVRDRLSQQRSILNQIRIIQVDSEQTGSDD